MKYIITAKNIFDGVTDHVTDPTQRTEIATELIMTRLKAIELLNIGVVSKTDCIVTRNDRRCLYENLFDSVIDYQTFLKWNMPASDVIDLVPDINTYEQTIQYHPVYSRFELDKKQIFNIKLFEYSDIETAKPYICILIRQTPNHPEKNLPLNYWGELIDQIPQKYNIMVFGLHNSEANDLKPFQHLRQIIPVFNFRGWCTALSHPNCKAVISSCTGGVYPLFFVGNPETKLIIIDNNKLVSEHFESPSFYNDCINFKKVHKKIYEEIPAPEKIVRYIDLDYLHEQVKGYKPC